MKRHNPTAFRYTVGWMLSVFLFLLAGMTAQAEPRLRGTGDLGVIIERADGAVLVVETTGHTMLHRVEGLGDLSHASVVFSRDERYAFLFGRDGGLSKIDLLTGTRVGRVMQGGNSIGGAISQDGTLVAVSNYEPGGVRIFDSATLKMVADIPATGPDGKPSKTVGLVDIPGKRRFLFSLFDANQIWMADLQDVAAPKLTPFKDIGAMPYDALISGEGRYYIAGLFGEDGLALLDVWYPQQGVRRILDGYGQGEKRLPVYKMPHLEGWTMANGMAFLPAIGRHEVLVVDTRTWKEAGRIPVHSQPVFVMARPDERQVWVNFAHPDNDTVQVIDVPTMKIIQTLKPGKGIMHMEFTPRGEQVWLSVRDEDRVDVYDTETLKPVHSLPVRKPSGIFFTARAHRIGL